MIVSRREAQLVKAIRKGRVTEGSPPTSRRLSRYQFYYPKNSEIANLVNLDTVHSAATTFGHPPSRMLMRCHGSHRSTGSP